MIRVPASSLDYASDGGCPPRRKRAAILSISLGILTIASLVSINRVHATVWWTCTASGVTVLDNRPIDVPRALQSHLDSSIRFICFISAAAGIAAGWWSAMPLRRPARLPWFAVLLNAFAIVLGYCIPLISYLGGW